MNVRATQPNKQQGVALVLVVWFLTLITVLLAAFTLLSRTENMQSRYLHDTARARYAAEAGINHAVFALMLPDPTLRYIPDGRVYKTKFGKADLEVEVTDESGLIDLNSADIGTLSRLFMAHGKPQEQADAIAAAVVDWRDADDMVSPNGAEKDEYEAADYAYTPRNQPFATVSEIQQVMGVDHEFYRRIADAITIYSGGGMPNFGFAPLSVLQSVPELQGGLAQALLQARHQYDPHRGTGSPPIMPDGRPLSLNGGSGVYTIRCRAKLANGATTTVDATVRIGGGFSGLAYTILRWQDGHTL